MYDLSLELVVKWQGASRRQRRADPRVRRGRRRRDAGCTLRLQPQRARRLRRATATVPPLSIHRAPTIHDLTASECSRLFPYASFPYKHQFTEKDKMIWFADVPNEFSWNCYEIRSRFRWAMNFWKPDLYKKIIFSQHSPNNLKKNT